jgi:hypothetical protein
MNTNRQVPRRTITIRNKPPVRFDRSEGRSMTPTERQAFIQHLVEHLYLPVLNGSVSIREVITPAGGWESLDARYPNLMNDSPMRQLKIAIWGKPTPLRLRQAPQAGR